jgi:hypothetical protein
MWYTLKDFHPPKIVLEKTMNAHLYGFKTNAKLFAFEKKKKKVFQGVWTSY